MGRVVDLVTNPPNLQNLKQAHKGEGLPSPYPLPPPFFGELFADLAYSGPSWTSKILRKNVHFLFMGPLGADNDTIKPSKPPKPQTSPQWGGFTMTPILGGTYHRGVPPPMVSTYGKGLLTGGLWEIPQKGPFW